MALGDFVDKAKGMAKDKLGNAMPDDKGGTDNAKDQANKAGNDAKQSADHLKKSAGDVADKTADSATNQVNKLP